MIKRCIMIFPHFKNIEYIDNIRRKYDPLAEHVRPHITLVFPFDSYLGSDELKRHIETAVKGIKPFRIILNGITPSTHFNNYLFLNIKEGNDKIIELNKKLYSGILKEYYPAWLKDTEYMPHMTVGNISNLNEFNKAVEETENINEVFETIGNTISVEVIDENDDSIIELHIPLEEESCFNS